MSESPNRNGASLPWYQQIISNLRTNQSEIFVLHGDILGYPQYPSEPLVPLLKRLTLAPDVARLARENPEYRNSTEDGKEALLANQRLFCTLSPAKGLEMNTACREVFSRFTDDGAPPTPFPQQGGSLLAGFQKIDRYFSSTDDDLPPLALVVHDADLVFDMDSPLVEPERTLTSFLRRWSYRPLVCKRGNHRVFLLAPAAASLRPALRQGRIATVKIPMPTLDERRAFLDRLFTGENAPQVKLEKDFDLDLLARGTGALNLLQIEDVVYQAQILGDGLLTREMVRDRKDELVRLSYGGAIEITYPDQGFDSLVGFDDLKLFLKGYVYPKLRDGDGRCPKGMVLSGCPGTGKTHMASALAAELKMPLAVFRSNLVKSKYVGETNRNMARVFEAVVALAPCIILMDEMDKLLPSTDDNTGVSQEMLGMLQSFMSEVKRGQVFFIGTTNYPSRIPSALRRPGRFEQVIPMLPQHLDGVRGEVLRLLVSRLGITVAKGVGMTQYNAVAKQCNDYTGADVEKLLIEADRIATMRTGKNTAVTQDDLMAATECVVPIVRFAGDQVAEALECCTNPSYVPKSMRDRVGRPAETRKRDDSPVRRGARDE